MQPRKKLAIKNAQVTHRSETEEVMSVVLERAHVLRSSVITEAQLQVRGKEGELLLKPKRRVQEVSTNVLVAVRSLHGTTVYAQEGIDIDALDDMDEKTRRARLQKGYRLLPLFHDAEPLSAQQVAERAAFFTPMPELEEMLRGAAAELEDQALSEQAEAQGAGFGN